MSARPQIEKFIPREIGPKPWGTELLVARTKDYSGKVLTMRAGTSGPLQYHELKDETFYLFSGDAKVDFVMERIFCDGDYQDVVTSVPMLAGESYHIPPGAIHRVHAITECVFFEASTPVFEDRVNVEAQYDT